MIESGERRYWLWVTRPDFYLDEDGNDREDLDPDSGVDSDGWWTCHKDTKKGDLVFLWRTSPKKDIGYLIQAESDAYSIADDNDHGWEYGCDHQMLYKFCNPINIKELRNNPYFDDWGPINCSFQRSSFEISKNYWDKLNQLAAKKNPGYRDFIEQVQKEPISGDKLIEEQVEERLATSLKMLRKFGHDLELYTDPVSKQIGRQFICKGNGGRIDLLCVDKKQNRYVVIELKIVRAGQNTFGQISNYVGWVQKKVARDVPVIGIVISRGYDTKFESALKITDRISQINIEDLGFILPPTKKTPKPVDPRTTEASKPGITSRKSREAGDWLNRGNELYDQAKYDEAIACYDKVIEVNPKNKWAWINKCAALGEMGRSDEAIETIDKAIEENPQSADIWFNKGIALLDLDENEDAIVAFDKAIEIKSKFADAWNGKGMALANMKKHEEAVGAYNKAIAIRPKFAAAWNNKGLAFADQGKYEEAIQALEKAIDLDSHDANAWIIKGSVFIDQNKYDDAIAACDKAIEFDSQNANAWIVNGRAFYGKTSYENSVQAFHKAIELNPREMYAWYHKGKALNQQGKLDAAIEAYDKAIKISEEEIRLKPQNANAWSLKGYTLYEQGNYNMRLRLRPQSLPKSLSIDMRVKCLT